MSLLTHKGSIQYQPSIIGIRTILDEIEAIGFGAKYEPKSDRADIRRIVNETVQKYKRRFAFCMIF